MKKETIHNGLGDLGFFVMIIVFVVLFAGEPDLHDVLIKYLGGL